MPFGLLLIGLAALLLSGCRESTRGTGHSDTGGTIVIATSSEPDALFPPAAMSMEARQATELIYEYLADVGVSMNTIGDRGFVPELASRWTWANDSMSIAFTIHQNAKWQDGRRVSADDVAFTYGIYSDSTFAFAGAEDLADIDSVTVRDSATAVFWFAKRTPHQFFDAAARMLILPRHILGAIPRDSLRTVTARMTPVGSGRFRLGGWNRGTSFELDAVADHYRGRANPDRIIWTIAPEYQTAVTRLLGGQADVFAALRPETIAELGGKSRFNVVSLPGMDYVFMQLNLRDASGRDAPHPLFASRDLRRALTMAVDRRAMVKNLFDTLATVSIGPAVRAFPTTDTTLAQIPFDPAAAGRLLDSLGWRRPANGGIRMRDGRRLAFTVIVPSSSMSRTRLAVLMQEQLRQVGAEMNIDQMDYAAFSDLLSGRRFDAALAAWHLGSSPAAVRDTWTSAAAKKGGLNYGGYRNPAFDNLVDSALEADRIADTRRYFKQANQMIVDDAPAIWLYEPRTVLAIEKRVRITPMRPNAWWLDIANWMIPAAERIPRDRSQAAGQSSRKP
ncbi:MAG: peptide ABC transporter substrate-binding protein [Gemmatimonadaceae bacterium]|nr:peptide ABC transporter substrate-binding protein [Gemmatimonadaceae bacterium]